ncbi:MAG: DUF2905 domain-containing protein [Marinifilaceae bacterium]|jgi:uncharacterized membrane protein YidH (DUF202 family)
MQHIGKYLIGAGILLLVIGIVLYFSGNKLNWLGNLPGDFKFKSGNVQIYFPLTTIVIITIVLNLILWLIRKL